MEVENNSFYESALQNSNTVDLNSLKQEILNNHPDFDFEEFNKDIRSIDFKALMNSLDFSKITAKFETQQAKDGKGTKSTGIQTFSLKQGHILGIGNRSFQSSFLIKGIKAQYTQHPYKFGDDEQKALLKKPLSELQLYLNDMTYGEIKKLMTFQIQFQIFSQERLLQSEECNESLKYLMLIKEIIGKLVKEDASLKALPNYTVEGFIKEKYNEFSKEDINLLTVNVQLIPKFSKDVARDAVINYYFDSKTNELIVNSAVDMNKSLEQIMNPLMMKPMDIVVAIDDCSAKKEGKKVTLMPKLNACNVVLQKNPDESKPRGHGLNYKNFKNPLIQSSQEVSQQ